MTVWHKTREEEKKTRRANYSHQLQETENKTDIEEHSLLLSTPKKLSLLWLFMKLA